MAKIGLSLSSCVGDIARGAVNAGDVTVIYTSTSAETDEQWTKLIEYYKRKHWSDCVGAIDSILIDLISANKIVQTRIKESERCPQVNGSHWVDDESKITWVPNAPPRPAAPAKKRFGVDITTPAALLNTLNAETKRRQDLKAGLNEDQAADLIEIADDPPSPKPPP